MGGLRLTWAEVNTGRDRRPEIARGRDRRTHESTYHKIGGMGGLRLTWAEVNTGRDRRAEIARGRDRRTPMATLLTLLGSFSCNAAVRELWVTFRITPCDISS